MARWQERKQKRLEAALARMDERIAKGELPRQALEARERERVRQLEQERAQEREQERARARKLDADLALSALRLFGPLNVYGLTRYTALRVSAAQAALGALHNRGAAVFEAGLYRASA